MDAYECDTESKSRARMPYEREEQKYTGKSEFIGATGCFFFAFLRQIGDHRIAISFNRYGVAIYTHTQAYGIESVVWSLSLFHSV